MFKLIRTTPLAALAAIALAVAACSGSEPSGLATLESVTTTTAGDSLTAAGAEAGGVAVAATETTAAAAAVNPASDADSADADASGADTDAGASGADADAGTGSNASSSDDLTDEERLLEFAQCMRDNGVEFPDPVVEADGTIAFGLRPGRGGGGQGETLQNIGRDPDLPAARAACQPIIEGLALGPGGQNFDEVRIELMDRLLEFAQCMRDNGVDVPDPDPNAFSPGSGGGRPFGDLDFDDADVSEAFEVCGDRLPARPGRGGGQ